MPKYDCVLTATISTTVEAPSARAAKQAVRRFAIHLNESDELRTRSPYHEHFYVSIDLDTIAGATPILVK